MFKKRIVTLMSVCACLMATHGAGVVNAGTLAMSDSEMAGDRICLLHLYDWNESASGVVTVTQSDPFYYGGWTATVGAGETPGYLTVEGGITMYAVPQPLRVDYALRTVTLEATDEPFATLRGSKTTVVDGVTTTVDSVQHFYIVNEAWVKQTGDLEDVVGEILPDGTIHIEPGFAYYIETTRTTTITAGSHSRTFTDETQDVSRVFRDTWLMRPNGKHEYVSQATGEQHSSDVYIYQSGDTVHVVNLYGYGAPEVHMLLSEDGTMCHIIDSAPSATFERIKGESPRLYDEATGSYISLSSPAQIPGSVYYIDTEGYSGAEYWLPLDYVVERGVRLIQP